MCFCHCALQFNFVGKILGPKGNSLKRIQEETGTRMAVFGRGSMRDKHKVCAQVVYIFFVVFTAVSLQKSVICHNHESRRRLLCVS